MSEKPKNPVEQHEKTTASPDLLVDTHIEIETAADKGPSASEKSADSNAEKERRDAEKEASTERVTNEALELAESAEKRPEPETEKPNAIEQDRPLKPTKAELNANFDQAMTQIQSKMSPASRTFSKVIHNPVVDKASSAVGNTIARPNLILAGSIGTLVACSLIYLVSKHYGYELSGSEAIATFVVGWAIGAVVEFARVGFSAGSKK